MAEELKLAVKIVSRANPEKKATIKFVDVETGQQLFNLDGYRVVTLGDFEKLLSGEIGLEDISPNASEETEDTGGIVPKDNKPEKSIREGEAPDMMGLGDFVAGITGDRRLGERFQGFGLLADGRITFGGRRTAANGFGYFGDTRKETLARKGIISAITAITGPVGGLLARTGIMANNVLATQEALRQNNLPTLSRREVVKSMLVGTEKVLSQREAAISLPDILGVDEVETKSDKTFNEATQEISKGIAEGYFEGYVEGHPGIDGIMSETGMSSFNPNLSTSGSQTPAGPHQGFYDGVFSLAQSKGYNTVQSHLAAAQATHETAGGTRVKGGNYFGIKGPSPTGRTQSFATHEYAGQKITDTFAAYDNLEESFDHYVSQMERNFSKAWNALTLEEATANLQKGRLGEYGTHRDKAGNWIYGGLVLGVAKTYGANVTSLSQPQNISLKDSLLADFTGPRSVAEVQEALNELGYNVDVDGIMGPQTASALSEFGDKMASIAVSEGYQYGKTGRSANPVNAFPDSYPLDSFVAPSMEQVAGTGGPRRGRMEALPATAETLKPNIDAIAPADVYGPTTNPHPDVFTPEVDTTPTPNPHPDVFTPEVDIEQVAGTGGPRRGSVKPAEKAISTKENFKPAVKAVETIVAPVTPVVPESVVARPNELARMPDDTFAGPLGFGILGTIASGLGRIGSRIGTGAFGGKLGGFLGNLGSQGTWGGLGSNFGPTANQIGAYGPTGIPSAGPGSLARSAAFAPGGIFGGSSYGATRGTAFSNLADQAIGLGSRSGGSRFGGGLFGGGFLDGSRAAALGIDGKGGFFSSRSGRSPSTGPGTGGGLFGGGGFFGGGGLFGGGGFFGGGKSPGSSSSSQSGGGSHSKNNTKG